MVKAATTCLKFSQPIVPHSASTSQALAPSPLKRCGRSEGALLSLLVQRADRTTLFGSEPRPITRSRSCEQLKSKTWKSACRASLDAFSEEDLPRNIDDLAQRFRSSNDGEESLGVENTEARNSVNRASIKKQKKLSLSEIRQESLDWAREEIIPASIEWKANRVEIPVSLRLIKKKLKREEDLKGVGEYACCSINNAFSSMVFIIRELQSYTLQMRKSLFYEDLEGILVRVEKETNASFVWLFQQVFSRTPTLMVSVMILLANYSVHSMGSAPAVAGSPPAVTCAAVAGAQDQSSEHLRIDASSVNAYSVSSSRKPASVGSNDGSGVSELPRVASGRDGGDGWFNSSDQLRPVVDDGASELPLVGSTREEEWQAVSESELTLWNSMVEAASRLRGDSLDDETKRRFVSPVTAKVDTDDYCEHLRTELVYQARLSEDPKNSLILTNYAQFLYLVSRDYDRAQEYFKEAIAAEPVDPEARSKYAMFLWRAKNDLWGAEESFLEAISAEPDNSYYAAGYANFLWNTGGEDTCFPLESEDTAQQEQP